MPDTNWADFKPAPDQPVAGLVSAITHVESGGDAGAVSTQGATGSMQVRPDTFRQYAQPGEDYGRDADRRSVGVRKIVDDYLHYGGDIGKTAAAYIGGRGAVRGDGTIRDDVADANGTTPAAYAQTVLGRMSARPAVDWSQFSPVPDAGGGRGFVNPAPADASAAPPQQPAGTVFQPDDTFDAESSGGPEIVKALQANPPAGAGRGYVNPPDVNAPRDVGPGESFIRGWGRAGADMAKTIGLAPAVLGVAVDSVVNAVTGGNSTTAQDAMFRQLVDPGQRAIDWYTLAPDEKQGTIAKIADGIGAMVQELPSMIASGGMSAEPAVIEAMPTLGRFLQQAASRGFDAMRPVMMKAGADRAQQVLDSGGTVQQAVIAGTTDAIATGMQGAQPMSAEGSIARRVITGLPVGAVQSEANRVISNASVPANMQVPFSPEAMAVGAVTNAAAGGVLGHAGEPARAARTEGTRDPVADVFKAGTVDEAIQAAQNAVDTAGPAAEAVQPGKTLEQELAELRQRTAGAQSVADEMRAIRPTSAVDAGDVGESGNGTDTAADQGASGVDAHIAAAAAGDRERAAVLPGAPTPAADVGGIGDTRALELAQTPADAGVSASGARPYQVERTESGSLMVRGDKATIREALANLPPNAMVPTRDGIQVATSWSDRAERVLQAFDPAAYSDFNGKKVAIKVEAEDGTQATLKMDAGRALRATDARERELQRLRDCVGGAA